MDLANMAMGHHLLDKNFTLSANMWSRSATMALITMYKRHDCLWRTSSPFYRNKKERQGALSTIAISLSPYRPNTSVDDVKNKINGIRTQYVAQRNKISAYASQNMVCESNLWCYEALNFLAPYTNVKTKYMDDIQKPMIRKIYIDPHTLTSTTRHSSGGIKLEPEDESEMIDSEDFFAEASYEAEHEEPLEEEYEPPGPAPKRQRVYSDAEDLQNMISTSKPEITLIKSTKKAMSTAGSSTETEEGRNEEVTGNQVKFDPFLMPEMDNLDLFGRFVTSQMRQITSKTLLVKLQHTIQSAIMETQLQQIELDE